MSSMYQRRCPPGDYVCRICHIAGHYVENCPRKEEHKRALDGICAWHDPFSDKPRCQDDGYCGRQHFNQQEFKQFCASKLKQNPRELKEIAKEYFLNHTYSCAKYAYFQLINAYPNNAIYASGYGCVLDAINDYDNAEKYHLKALNLSPTDDRFHRLYGIFLHRKLNKTETAEKYFMNALRLNELSPSTHNEYGLLLEDENKYKQAEDHYLKAIKVCEIAGKSIYCLAKLYHYKLKNLNKSKYYFDTLLSLQYNRKRWWFHDHKLFSHHYKEYALLLRDIGNIDQSLEHFNVALEKIFYDDDKAEIYWEIGKIYDSELKDIRNAKWYFNEAKNLNPKQYQMFYNEFIKYHQLNCQSKHINEVNKIHKGNKLNDDYSNQSQQINENKTNKLNENKRKCAQRINQNQMGKWNDNNSNHSNKNKINVNALNDNSNNKNSNNFQQKNENKCQKETKSQIAFKKYLQRMGFHNYYDMFAANDCNDMKFLEVFDDEMLRKEIKMNDEIHRKFFIKEIEKFIHNKTRFEYWLNKMKCEHHLQSFQNNAIFTHKQFYQNIKQKDDLLIIIGTKHSDDANIIWNATEKQTRKVQNNQFEGSIK